MTLDNRGMRPPEPMVRTLGALEELNPGERLMIINDRRPMFLFEELDEQGIQYECEPQKDGSFKIIIQK
ncbi:DUF2249 domain-containing protein [Alkalibacillus aidingensis]|uniref:DUF2249 domain-containing protein n=1 Tax=Alkalibacillus aidingensis TaxID=2747607 RepID=UPI00166011B2|nr:DUF2249 domain-containing protein [Alkalibacillus aidingensis]